ncbi:MAG: LuxR C-terminal-related transcriptional regulator [Coriobacteriales bacterium]|jgi:DNA-binding CsgD family transcriptional regulator|nr:LuxR C-terminal-related transcriptional regulator [Coriobacteriales bacterium]
MQNKQKPAIIKRQEEGSVVIDFFLAIGIFGNSLFLAWMFLLFGSTLFSLKLIPSGEQTIFLHIGLTLGVIFTLCLTLIFSKTVFRLRNVLPIFAILFSVSNLWVELFDIFGQGSWLYYLTWPCTGIGLAIMVLIWSEFSASLKVGQAKLFIGLSACFAAIWVAIVLITVEQFRYFLVYALPFLSLLVMIFLRNYYLFFLNLDFIDAKTSLSRMRMSYKPVLSTFGCSCALSFVLSWFITFKYDDIGLNLALVLFCLVAAIILVVDTVRWKRLGENFMVRSFLIFVAIGMLPLLFISDVGKVVCCVILVCGMLYSLLHSMGALCEHINIFKLSPMFTFAFGRVFSYLGILVGLIGGYIAFWLQPFGDTSLAIVTFTLMLVVVVATVLVKMENNYPINDHDVNVGGMYAVKLELHCAQESEISATEDNVEKTEQPKLWRRKCEGVAAAYGLTQRQTEVLVLLSKGRNADYITKELFISLHTAKAHIYNIYQKMGVHGRQDLIDIIERVRIDI